MYLVFISEDLLITKLFLRLKIFLITIDTIILLYYN